MLLHLLIISMKQLQKSNTLKVSQELHYSRASSYIFDEEQQSIDLGASVPRHQKSYASIKIVVPEQAPNSNNNQSLTFEEKVQNLSFALRSEVEGQQVFKQFLVKFQSKEKKLDQAIRSILSQQSGLGDLQMTICMFYLTYISYYFVRNHAIMLNDEFQDQRIGMVKTNFSFARHKKLIGINYQTLYHCNYGGKVRILEILEQRMQKRLRDLQNVLKHIGPCLHWANESDVAANLRKVGQDMYTDGVEKTYSNIQFGQLLQHFHRFVRSSRIKLQPRIEDYLKLFESDSGQA